MLASTESTPAQARAHVDAIVHAPPRREFRPRRRSLSDWSTHAAAETDVTRRDPDRCRAAHNGTPRPGGSPVTTKVAAEPRRSKLRMHSDEPKRSTRSGGRRSRAHAPGARISRAEVLRFPCPLCFAAIGAHCTGRRGPRVSNHDERQAVALRLRI
jgi:hypothetical protein